MARRPALPTVAAVIAVLTAAPLFAQEPPDLGSATFEAFHHGIRVATEVSELRIEGDALVLTCRGDWDQGGVTTQVTAEARYAGGSAQPLVYTFEAIADGRHYSNRVEFQSTTALLRSERMGARKQLDLSLPHPPILLDNMVIGVLRVIAVRVPGPTTDSRRFTAVVPHATRSMPLALQTGESATLVGPEGPVACESIHLMIGRQLTSLYLRSSDRALIAARVLSERFDAIRSGWVLPAAPSRPAYIDPAAFTSLDVAADSDCGPAAGTLCVPTGAGPFPAAVFLHGSGPQDRDESIGDTRVFRDLAEGLASQGIATFRYDKPARAPDRRPATGQDPLEREVLADAAAVLAAVRGRPTIDPRRVFLIGHSLGGLLAPEVALRDGKVAGIVLLATPGRPLREVAQEQWRTLETQATEAGDPAEAESMRALRLRLDEVAAGSVPDAEEVGGTPAATWRALFSRDIRSLLRKAARPTLVLHGERDFQVGMADFQVLSTLQQEMSLPACRARSYPALNHLFVAGVGKSSLLEYARSGQVDRQVVIDIAEWIQQIK